MIANIKNSSKQDLSQELQLSCTLIDACWRPNIFLRNLQLNAMLLTLTSITFEVTSLNVIITKLSFSCNLSVLSIFKSQMRQYHPNESTYLHPIHVGSLVIATIIVFRIKYYSIIFSVLIICHSLMLIRSDYRNKTTLLIAKPLKINISIVGGYFSLCLLTIQQIIPLNIKYLIILILILLFKVIGECSFYSYRDTKQLLAKQAHIYTSCLFRMFFTIFTIDFSFICLFLLIIQFCINQSSLSVLIRYIFVIQVIISLVYTIFSQEIFILSILPVYTEAETLFKVADRTFLLKYSSGTCKRQNIPQDHTCLLCQNQATTVYFPCGHLNLCSKCDQKRETKIDRRKKTYRRCLICNSKFQSLRILKFESKRQGFTRKWFIEKKLMKNQYLTY